MVSSFHNQSFSKPNISGILLNFTSYDNTDSKVYLHSTGIKDPKGKIICQIADIVWGQGQEDPGATTDPPETGILLPGTGGYKKYVQYFAEKIVTQNPGAGFSDTSYTNNNAR